MTILKNSAGSYHRSEVGDQGYPTLRFASTASSYLAFAVLARPVALLLVAALTFFLDDVRVDVFFVVDGRVGVLLLLVFVDLAVTGSSAVVDAATFFLVVVEVRLVVFGSVDVASTFSVDEGVFLRVARSDLFPSC